MSDATTTDTTTISTDEVAPRERVPYWSDWVNRLFHGLRSDLYGDTDFDGRIASAPGSHRVNGASTTPPMPTPSPTRCGWNT